MSKKYRQIKIACLLIVVTALAGCETIRYYSHAVSGQLKILNNRQPIETLLREPETPDRLKKKLALVLELREFAKNELLLPVDDHYLSYTDLKRPYAVWTVYAAPEFSVKPETWYYPFVGRSAYRGFFSESKAQKWAEKLKHKGLDVHVGGASAYSTLGWFDDSVFSTAIRRSETGIAALIFHELAHQLLYVKGDTVFNESFATTVEQEGLRRWLDALVKTELFEQYLIRNRRHDEFVELILTYRQKLEKLYDQNIPDPIKRQKKRETFVDMKKEYQTLKKKWGGYTGYDLWFSKPLNNARLVPIGVYHDFVPAFNKILARENGDLKAFYDSCRALAGENKTERRRRLTSILSTGEKP